LTQVSLGWFASGDVPECSEAIGERRGQPLEERSSLGYLSVLWTECRSRWSCVRPCRTALTRVERNFGHGIGRAYAGHADKTGPATTTSTYIKPTYKPSPPPCPHSPANHTRLPPASTTSESEPDRMSTINTVRSSRRSTGAVPAEPSRKELTGMLAGHRTPAQPRGLDP
jgi:hypothetical protein